MNTNEVEISKRICVTCNEELPATTEYYHKAPKGKNGLCSKCKKCRHLERSKYYENHKEEKRMYDKLYRALNKAQKEVTIENKNKTNDRKNKINPKVFLEC